MERRCPKKRTSYRHIISTQANITEPSELRRQKQILRAVIEASGHLFSNQDILNALDGVVSTIGNRFGADKCLIYGKGLTQGFIENKMLQLASYNSKNQTVTIDDYDCYELINCKSCFLFVTQNMLDFGHFETGEQLEREMSVLQENGIAYMLAYPLFIKESLWGTGLLFAQLIRL